MSPPLLMLEWRTAIGIQICDYEFKKSSPLPVDGAVRNRTDNWMGVSPILRNFPRLEIQPGICK